MPDLSGEPGYERVRERIESFLNGDDRLFVIHADVAGWHAMLACQIARAFHSEVLLAATGNSGAHFQKLMDRKVMTVHRALYAPAVVSESEGGTEWPNSKVASAPHVLLVDLHGLLADDLRNLQRASEKLIVIVTSDQMEVLDGKTQKPFAGRAADITLRLPSGTSLESPDADDGVIEVPALRHPVQQYSGWKPAQLADTCAARSITPDWDGIYLVDSGVLLAIICRKNAFGHRIHAGDIFVPAGTELPDELRDRFILVVPRDITPDKLAVHDGRRFACVPREIG